MKIPPNKRATFASPKTCLRTARSLVLVKFLLSRSASPTPPPSHTFERVMSTVCNSALDCLADRLRVRICNSALDCLADRLRVRTYPRHLQDTIATDGIHATILSTLAGFAAQHTALQQSASLFFSNYTTKQHGQTQATHRRHKTNTNHKQPKPQSPTTHDPQEGGSVAKGCSVA